jgi:hypothetical protein
MHLFIHNFPVSKLTGENVVADLGGNPKPVFDLRFRFQTNKTVPPNMFCRGKHKIYARKTSEVLT